MSAIGLGTAEEPDVTRQDYSYNEEEPPMPARERDSHYSSSRGYSRKESTPQDNYGYDDPQDDMDYEDDYRAPASSYSSYGNSSSSSKIINHPANNVRHRTMIYQLTSYEDSRDVIDDLLEGHSVLINLEDLDLDQAQRIVDTLIGACYAINSTIKPAAKQTYLLAPESVEVAGTYAADARSGHSIMNDGKDKDRY